MVFGFPDPNNQKKHEYVCFLNEAWLAHSKNIVAFPGGLPIKTKNGTLLGAIGVSGATGDEDEQCANAALLAVDEYL